MMRVLPLVRLAVGTLIAAFASPGICVEPATAGVLSVAQARRGLALYGEKCAMCHGATLQGRDAPALAGRAFAQKFGSADRLHDYLSRSMPPFAPGRLEQQHYLDITAYILSVNGARTGDHELGRNDLASIDLGGMLPVEPDAENKNADIASQDDTAVPQAFTWGSELPLHHSVHDKAAVEAAKVTIAIPDRIDSAAGHAVVHPDRHYEPVSDAMLLDPPPGEWLMSRGTLSVYGYSPLAQIDRNNVADLELAWAWPMAEGGQQQTAPLVHDGIMFIATTDDVVQALDAASGDLIWEFRPELAELPPSWGYQRYQARRQKGSI
ncbi:MAG: c-type cytochrome, partial [Xanthomonadales bacterium]|nr:c-type cytochrome [Xanthomonadales bacterium]